MIDDTAKIRYNIVKRQVLEESKMNDQTAVIRAVCISEKKGQQKHPVESVHLRPEHGIDGDAHAARRDLCRCPRRGRGESREFGHG